MKACFRCGAVKPLDEFYRHPFMADGHLGKCKDCTRSDVRQYREANITRYRQYDRERFQRPERRAQVYQWNRERKMRDPQKTRARQATLNAIRAGRLVRLPCEACGTTVRVEAHHPDYSKPLDVRWLCDTHHHEEHRRMERAS